MKINRQEMLFTATNAICRCVETATCNVMITLISVAPVSQTKEILNTIAKVISDFVSSPLHIILLTLSIFYFAYLLNYRYKTVIFQLRLN